MILRKIVQKVKKHPKKILFVDSSHTAVLKASALVSKQKTVIPVFMGKKESFVTLLKKKKITIPRYEVIHPKDHYLHFVKEYARMRKGHKESIAVAKEAMLHPTYFAMMCLHKGLVDGVVSGFTSETKPFVPAFRVVGVQKKYKKVSSCFLMVKEKPREIVYLYADCGLNIDPSSAGLAEIALQTADSAKLFGITPKIAMLSFSTQGSAKHELVDKVAVATTLVKERAPRLSVEGEIQFDAAVLSEVAKKKISRSVLKGKANTFIFPDLNAGNIAYKITERLAGFRAIGPLLQGLHKPVNDMSRGASVEDIALIACITALQAK